MNTSLVSVRHLSKYFDNKKAVDDISFDIVAGEVFGFLGPNGAGKTTTIRMLLNILTPSSGDLRIFGLHFHHHRSEILQQMNASSGTLTLPGKLSVVQNLEVFSDLYGLKNRAQRINEMIEKFDLGEFRDRSLYSLSTGQQVRVSLAKAFLNRPKLLLLDEPTASLDPDVADRVRTFLLNLVQEEGTTIFLTSHNMVEVEKVCSRVVFINQGRIQAEGSPKELAWKMKRVTLRLTTEVPLLQKPVLSGADHPDFEIEGHRVTIDLNRDDVGAVVAALVKQGVVIKTLSTKEPTLEDFFVHTARKDAVE